ncbi:disease resistance protein (TIR-NBS-LRR class) [Medicago truncatula]|uniref:Disease resistance protein (TIR-NBS-LRR class) n=1 Tax=Medicago truncatula TaxID=3880 RepID=G7ZUP2_MEDTR|nr:disease resistance protein (TIR-NBS-LRR class) [Medicago truncatula]
MEKSSSSSSSTNPKQTHEVFLSFRGEDTRKTFTSHLNSALRRLDIKTYIDDNLERGDEISQALLKEIDEAKLSVIVFSKNYATSKWCLDEVVKILECRKYKEQIILPDFYEVDPFHVRHQLGSLSANHSGWDCSINRTEAELVEEIAMDVLIDTYENQVSHEATVQRITELKMKRSIHMLRLTREMLSYMEDSEAYEKLF